MQLWIILAIIAHFLNAVTAIIDKYIVSGKVLKPVAYAFYSGIFQILYLLAIPVLATVWPEMTFRFPSWELFALAVFNGALFIFALVVFYKAISLSEISRVTPIVGVSVPIFIYLMSFLAFGQTLEKSQAAAFILFVAGGLLMSTKFKNGEVIHIKGSALAISAGLLFAVYYVLMDYLYDQVGFLDVFMIMQFGGFVGAALLLVSSDNRKVIFAKDKESGIKKNSKESITLFIYDKVAAAIAAILLSYSISIGNVIIINSLQSVQYVFTFLIALVLSKKIPELLNEQTGDNVVRQKSFALLLIALGLILVA